MIRRCAALSEAVREAAETDCAVLVSKMIAGERSLWPDDPLPGFRPCVMFGLGGIYAEALRDAVFRAALAVPKPWKC